MSDVAGMPEEFASATRDTDEAGKARIVADYVAGMTDRYAFREYDRLMG